MRVKVLGSAAGGGFPQWNCNCVNCGRLREGKFRGAARTQVQLAWSSTPSQWTLLNASPDLRFQIEATPELWPREGMRHSPIADVIVTSAELDQTLGLLLLREFHPFRVHTTSSIRRIFTEDNSFFAVLNRFPGQVCWSDMPLEQPFSAGGARLEVLPLSGSFPGFVNPSRLTSLNPAITALRELRGENTVRRRASLNARIATIIGAGVASAHVRMTRRENCSDNFVM